VICDSIHLVISCKWVKYFSNHTDIEFIFDGWIIFSVWFKIDLIWILFKSQIIFLRVSNLIRNWFKSFSWWLIQNQNFSTICDSNLKKEWMIRDSIHFFMIRAQSWTVPILFPWDESDYSAPPPWTFSVVSVSKIKFSPKPLFLPRSEVACLFFKQLLQSC